MKRLRPPPPARLLRAVVSPWVIGTVALVWLVLGLGLHDERAHLIARAWANGANLARVYSESLLRSVREIDQTLLFVRALHEREGDALDLKPWIDKVEPGHRLPVQISLVDRAGLVTISNLLRTPDRIDLSDRPHFRRFVESQEDLLHISAPLYGRISKRWTVQFVRMLTTGTGAFDGIAVGSVTPEALIRFADATDVGADGTVAIVGLTGIVRARLMVGQAGVTAGQAVASPFFARAAAEDSGGFVWTDPQDGVKRLESFRRVPGLPLMVTVGVSEEVVLAAYRKDALLVVPGGAAVTLLVLAAALVSAVYRLRRDEAELLLQRTLEHMNQGILVVAPDGRVPVMNRRAAELLGLPPELGAGCAIGEILSFQAAQGDSLPGVDPAALVAGRVAACDLLDSPREYRRTRPNGTVLDVRTQALPDGSAVRTFSDITARERDQQALQTARDEAETAMQARARFLAVMSHEIRTPLNGVLGVAALLADTALTPEQQGYVRIMRESGRHLATLVNDILDFTKIDQGAIELEVAPFNPCGMLETVRAMSAAQAEEKGLSLRVEIGDGVPDNVAGDAHRVRQVLLNLVGNAIKFTREGGVTIRLDAAPTATGWRLDFDVTDSGIGIPLELQGRLFQEFTQIDGSITREFGGTGLGLAICRRLVSAMGGNISVHSRVGEGTACRFDVAVCAVAVAEVAPVAEDGAGAPGADEPMPTSMSILLAEDNPVNRLVASSILQKLGHHVEVVEDGAAAVAAVQFAAFDLVVMDVMMPIMDGLAATRAIRVLPGQAGRVKIIGLTANAFHEDELECRTAGMDGFAPKPITADRLEQEIARICGAPPLAAVRALDGSALHELAKVLGETTVDDIVAAFLHDLPEQIARMQVLAAAGGWEGLTREAHALAGSSGTIGLRTLEAVARALERDLKAARPGDAAERVAMVAAEAADAATLLTHQRRRMRAALPAVGAPD